MQYLSEVIYYKKLGFKTYQDYLKSPQWKEKRQEYKEAGLPFLCRFCKRPTPILHHVDYSTLGKEDVYKDLVPVCSYHHQQSHWKGNKRIPLIKNALVGRQRELMLKNTSLWRQVANMKLGDVVNTTLYWAWKVYLPRRPTY